MLLRFPSCPTAKHRGRVSFANRLAPLVVVVATAPACESDTDRLERANAAARASAHARAAQVQGAAADRTQRAAARNEFASARQRVEALEGDEANDRALVERARRPDGGVQPDGLSQLESTLRNTEKNLATARSDLAAKREKLVEQKRTLQHLAATLDPDSDEGRSVRDELRELEDLLTKS